MHYFIILHYFIIYLVRHLGVCATLWLVMLTTQEFATLFEHMVSTTLICVPHPCRLILSSWHILSCLMEDNPYLVDTCLVVASSWCWLLDLLEVSQRPLYKGTPSVLWIMLHHAGSWHIMAYWIYCHSDHIWSLVLVLSLLVLGEYCPKENSYKFELGFKD